jgi:predicted nucleotide-binding protein (sugar kinase/HSP70/actin superfamily)
MRHLIICPIFYKELYESYLQLIVNLLQREGIETILFSVSDWCTLTRELKIVNENYYWFLLINHGNKNFNYILKQT